MNKLKLFLYSLIVCIAFNSCQNEIDAPSLNSKKNFSYDKVSTTKSTTNLENNKERYNFTTDWGYYENILIPQESVEKLESVVNINAPTYGSCLGYQRYTNIGKTYKLLIRNCDYLGDGIYVVQDCHVFVDLFFPNAPFIVIAQSSHNCGIHPDEPSLRGFIVEGYNSSTRKWTFKTRMIRILTDISGRSINSSYPEKLNNIVWNYAYYSGIY